MSVSPTHQRRVPTPTRRRPPPSRPIWSPATYAVGCVAPSPADGPFGAGVPPRKAAAGHDHPATTDVAVGNRLRAGRADGGDAP